MKHFNNFLPWLVILAVFGLSEQILQQPKQVYYLGPVILILIILSVWQLTGREVKIEKFWRFLITPLLFSMAGMLFLGFLEGQYARQLFLLGQMVLLWAYLEIIFLRYHLRPKYEPYSLENVTVHLNLITIYLTACGFYNLILFLAINFWLLLGLFVLIGLLMSYQLIWASGVTTRVGWHYLAVISLLTAELFWIVNYLPTSIYVNGLMVTLGYYLMSGLSRNWLLGIRDSQVIKRYLIIGSFILLIILITAKWF
ncbi:MAG: hypothetical protein WCX71_03870 [Candidatus Buchananbacteria bacterium]